MLEIYIPETRKFNENTQEFVYIKGGLLKLEHSLISVSKWESKWCKPFLEKNEKTKEEMMDYIRCMTLNPVNDPLIYNGLTNHHINLISKYIEAPMTATVINSKDTGKKEIVTSEIIYYWMISLQIPMECQKWHLKRLLTLIEVCSIKNQPGKKMSNKEILASNAKINKARREALGTKG